MWPSLSFIGRRQHLTHLPSHSQSALSVEGSLVYCQLPSPPHSAPSARPAGVCRQVQLAFSRELCHCRRKRLTHFSSHHQSHLSSSPLTPRGRAAQSAALWDLAWGYETINTKQKQNSNRRRKNRQKNILIQPRGCLALSFPCSGIPPPALPHR